MAIILLAITCHEFGPKYLKCKPPTSVGVSIYTNLRIHSELLVINGLESHVKYNFSEHMRSAAPHLSAFIGDTGDVFDRMVEDCEVKIKEPHVSGAHLKLIVWRVGNSSIYLKSTSISPY